MCLKQGQIEVEGEDENDYGSDECGDACGVGYAKLIKTFDDKDRLIVDKFVLFKNDTDKGIVIANKDLYATEVIDISEY